MNYYYTIELSLPALVFLIALVGCGLMKVIGIKRLIPFTWEPK